MKKLVSYTKELMVDRLNDFDWNLSSKSVNDKAIILVKRLNECVNGFLKKVEVSEYEENGWYDDELVQLRKKKDAAYKEAVLSSGGARWTSFRIWRNKYQRSLREKKSICIQNKLELVNGDSRQTWKILKKMLKGKQTSEIKDVYIDGRKISDSKEISQGMNAFFVDSIKEINCSIPAVSIPIPTSTSITNQPKSMSTFEFKKVSYPRLSSIYQR